MKVLVAVSFILSFKIPDFFFKLISNHFYVAVSIFFYCSKLKLFSTSKIAFKKAGKNIKLRKIKANTVYCLLEVGLLWEVNGEMFVYIADQCCWQTVLSKHAQ